jgi:predicted phage-related endonuclease
MLEKLKQLFSIVRFEAQLELVDGTIIKVDNLEVGAKAWVVSTDGDIELPDGSYELITGQVITITEGMISEITEPATEDETPEEETPAEEMNEEETPAEEMAEDETPAEETPAEEDEVSLEDRVVTIENQLTEILEKINKITEGNDFSADLEKLSNLETENKELKEKFESLYSKLEKIAGEDSNVKKVNVTEQPLSRRDQIKQAILNK